MDVADASESGGADVPEDEAYRSSVSLRSDTSPTARLARRGIPSALGAYRSPAVPDTPSTTASFSPSRFEASPTLSPGVRGLSVTPRNIFRPRISGSATPTAQAGPSQAPLNVDRMDVIDMTDEEDDWGGGAVLQWDGVDMTGDSASSVAPGDAGLDTDAMEDEEEWGREAYLEYDWSGDDHGDQEPGGGISDDDDSEDDEMLGERVLNSELDEGDDEEEEEVEESEEIVESGDASRGERAGSESLEELSTRGMPDYAAWELKKLQRMCEGYGYRPSKNHKALEKLAVACWEALNPAPFLDPQPAATPPPAPANKAKKGKARAKPRQDSVSSAEVLLSTKKPAPKAKAKAKGNGKAAEEEVEEVIPIQKRFAAMIKGDGVLYLRILQYEPIAFDELISKCVHAGIKDKGWKIQLKKFLDFEGITFYTEDPTGVRRSRH